MQTFDTTGYVKNLKKRGEKRHITQEFQLMGMEIATTLHDLPHKALYIKYAKQYGGGAMLALAKDIAERRDVKNLGAYFVSVVASLRTYENKRTYEKNKG